MIKQANNPIGLSNRTVSRRKFLQLAAVSTAAGALVALPAAPSSTGGRKRRGNRFLALVQAARWG
ncbi:MAG: twin-arginine translocation signal domain-containing protein [Caldilineaceae bacterium]